MINKKRASEPDLAAKKRAKSEPETSSSETEDEEREEASDSDDDFVLDDQDAEENEKEEEAGGGMNSFTAAICEAGNETLLKDFLDEKYIEKLLLNKSSHITQLQREAIEWMSTREEESSGGLLTDEMGLGMASFRLDSYLVIR
jgi:SNF2 family DNA or RNA helicase